MDILKRIENYIRGNQLVCNMCEWVGKESDLIIESEIEICPKCRNAGYLMDLEPDYIAYKKLGRLERKEFNMMGDVFVIRRLCDSKGVNGFGIITDCRNDETFELACNRVVKNHTCYDNVIDNIIAELNFMGNFAQRIKVTETVVRP